MSLTIAELLKILQAVPKPDDVRVYISDVGDNQIAHVKAVDVELVEETGAVYILFEEFN